jgi:ribonuclease T2
MSREGVTDRQNDPNSARITGKPEMGRTPIHRRSNVRVADRTERMLEVPSVSDNAALRPEFGRRWNYVRWYGVFLVGLLPVTSIGDRRVVSLILLAALMAAFAAARPAHAEQHASRLITLVWWPDYCHLNRNDRYCDGTSFRGFVLAGVRDDPESLCRTGETNTLVIDPAWLKFMPDARFINQQWVKSGICSGISPGDYFDGLERIYRGVQIPTWFILPNEHFEATTSEVKRAFSAANHLKDTNIAVHCERRFLSAVTIRKPQKQGADGLPLQSSCPTGTFWVIARMPLAE